ncbi:sulfotransferase family protein [Rubritalea sp.]|uniref:sulfotransferase family protein n=1 Tax=Rubritalea sp. TaxID=2109375 RepID=UPI003EF966FE
MQRLRIFSDKIIKLSSFYGEDRLPVKGLNRCRFLLHTFTEKQLLKYSFSNVSSFKKPIFIVGAPRSGTTFLGECISNVSGIDYFFEPVYTKSLGYDVGAHQISDEHAKKEFSKVYNALLSNSSLRFCEKTPTNIFLIEKLLKWFPGAQFIHIIRNGGDMAMSHVKKGWLTKSMAEPLSYEIGGYRNGDIPQFWVEPERVEEFRETTDLHRSIWAWRTHVEAGLAAGCNVDEKNYYEVRYEDLVIDPSGEADRMSVFLNFSENQKNEFINSCRSLKKNSIGKGVSQLSTEEKNLISDEAGVLLNKLNYDF